MIFPPFPEALRELRVIARCGHVREAGEQLIGSGQRSFAVSHSQARAL